MNKLSKILLLIFFWLVIAIITGVLYSKYKIGKFDFTFFLKGISIYSIGALFVLFYLIYKITQEKK